MGNTIETVQKVLRNSGNIIKTRDDRELILIDKDGKIQNEDSCGWLPENDGVVDKSLFRTRIEPWLTSLFQSEHLSLLCGSGITNAVSFLAGGSGGTTMAASTFTTYKNEIEESAKKSAKASGRDSGNIEDQIRTANDLLRGLRILNKNTEADSLEKELNAIISEFAKSILESEKAIATAADDKRENAYSVLVNFLLSFASRTGNRERLNIFTTNYDRLIEVGAELAGIHLMDRFVGTMMPIFRSSRLNLDIHYNPPGIRGEPRYLEGVARLTKLHGSVDWVQNENEIRRIGLPFGADDIAPYLNAPGLKGADSLKLMIYPNSAKDRETAEYESAHYAQMSVLMGSNLGDITNLANDYLPKSAIDRTTIRMAELLQHRMGTASSVSSTSATAASLTGSATSSTTTTSTSQSTLAK